MCIGRDVENQRFSFKDICYKNSKERAVLDITIDNKLNFYSYITNMCKKSVKKSNALSRISTFLNKIKKDLI